MDYKINVPGHGNNVVDGLNSTLKRYLKGGMGPIFKSASNDISNIVMIPSASKYVSIKFHINVYRFSIIKTGLIDSKIAQK